MLRQNQIGTMATMNISTMPTPKALHLRAGPDVKVAARDGVEHQEPDRGDGGHKQDQRPVHVQDLAQARWGRI
jgi:nitrous oxide reductase accessory protein NosL